MSTANVTPHLALHIRGPVATENAASGAFASAWDFDLNMAIIDSAIYALQQGGGGGGAVSSVFGRTGAVVAASGDYTAAQVTGAVPNTITVNGHALCCQRCCFCLRPYHWHVATRSTSNFGVWRYTNNAANTSGTAANLSGTPALPNGTTAATQPPITTVR